MNWSERLVKARTWPAFGVPAQFGLRILGLEVPSCVPIGPGLSLPHGAVGLVVHEHAQIGARAKLFGGVTLGRADQHLIEVSANGGIVIEDDVIIGAGAKVLFRDGQWLTIGRGAVVGANAVVTRSVPPGEVWAGVPAKRVGQRALASTVHPSSASHQEHTLD